MSLEEGAIEGVDLVGDLFLDATVTGLVVDHLGEDGQLCLGQLRLRGLDNEELSEGESGDDVWRPLQVAVLQGEVLAEIRRVKFTPGEDPTGFVATAVCDGIVEHRSYLDISEGDIYFESVEEGFSLVMIVVVGLSEQCGNLEIAL